jgi:uncharacterized protein YkwD
LDVTLTSLLVTVTTVAVLAGIGEEARAACRQPDPAAAVVCEINDRRAGRGLEPLAVDRRLERAGEAHARDMVRRGYFSHASPEGARVGDRLRAAGYIAEGIAWRVGEVLAWGRGDRSTPSAAVAAWMRSPLHRRVLLRAHYREIGVGVAAGVPFGGAGRTYATELGVLG